MKKLKYLHHYPSQTQDQVYNLIKQDKLDRYLLQKYASPHKIKNDKMLFEYISDLKFKYLKKSSPLSKVTFDGKISIIHNALGTHHFISRVQGNKLKAKNEIKIASLFKNVPEEFLKMIVVHELSHFKEKEHNKAFYKLCEHMQASYHQREFDLRVYLTHIDLYGKLEDWR
ncbi:YgjP-like metallopeptidase domain-containing protein [Sulfurimonas sp.]